MPELWTCILGTGGLCVAAWRAACFSSSGRICGSMIKMFEKWSRCSPSCIVGFVQLLWLSTDIKSNNQRINLQGCLVTHALSLTAVYLTNQKDTKYLNGDEWICKARLRLVLNISDWTEKSKMTIFSTWQSTIISVSTFCYVVSLCEISRFMVPYFYMETSKATFLGIFHC